MRRVLSVVVPETLAVETASVICVSPAQWLPRVNILRKC